MHHSIKMQGIAVVFCCFLPALTVTNACTRRRLESLYSQNLVMLILLLRLPVCWLILSDKLMQLFNWAVYCGVEKKATHSLSCDVFECRLMTHNGAMQAIQFFQHQFVPKSRERKEAAEEDTIPGPTSINDNTDRMRNHRNMLGFHFLYLEIASCLWCTLL